MAGRRRLRAASTSTVATVDENSVRYQKESQVLRPAPPGDRPDDWPCFLLADATVYDKHGEMANLLHVDLEGPFMVRGLLTIEPDQGSCLIKGQTKSRFIWIEIPKTYSYSIGLKEDTGMPVLWAAGESAHFELVPSERYASIASTMFQGITLHYHVLDLYEDELRVLKVADRSNPKHKRRKHRIQDVNLPVYDIFFKYAVAVGDGVTREEVMLRCKNQAGFLLAHFPRGTGFHNWLSAEFPDIVQKLGKKADPSPAAATTASKPELSEKKQPLSPPKPSSAKYQHVKGKGKTKADQDSSVLRSTRSNSKVQPETHDISSDELRNPLSQSNKAKRRSPPKAVEDEAATEAMDVDMHDFAYDRTTLATRTLPSSSKTTSGSGQHRSSLFTIIDVLNEERSKLLSAMASGKGKKHPDDINHRGWLTKVYLRMSITNYQAKAEIFDYYAADFVRHLGPEWHDSELYKWAKQNKKTKPKLEHITEEAILKLTKRQKNPKVPAKDSKASGLEGSQTPTETFGKHLHKSRLSGKAAGLRPSLGSKRRLRDLESDEDDMDIDVDNYPSKKTAKTSEYFSDGEDDGQVDASTSSNGDDQDDKDKDMLTRIIVRAEPLPSTKPKGPNHTWTCGEPDCEYVVRSADGQDGQDLILKHFEEHEQEASDEAKERELSKINLALQESRGHLPINHLLEKIRKASTNASKQNQVELDGRVVPQPIKRSLLV